MVPKILIHRCSLRQNRVTLWHVRKPWRDIEKNICFHKVYLVDMCFTMDIFWINYIESTDVTLHGDINREVSLHVKRERVRVTSHLGAQFRYTSRSRTLLGFASRRDVSTEKQGHRYQQMTRQQSIKRARKQKLMHSVQWYFGTW